MEKLIVKDNRWEIPERYQLGEQRKRLHIKTAWTNQIERLDKDCWQSTIQEWHRHPPEKPYIPEGFVEINGERFEVEFQ